MSLDSKTRYLVWLNIILIALAWYLTISNYPNLPDKIPYHFGASGTPDSWGGKETIFLEPGIQSGLFLLFLGLTCKLPHLPRSIINLPRDIKEELQKLSEESKKKVYAEIYSLLPTMLFGLDILLNLLFLFILVSTIKVASGEWQGLKIEFLVLFTVALIGISIYYSLRMNRKLRQQIKEQYP